METLFLHPGGDDFPKLFVPLCLHESLIQLGTDHEELFCLLDAPLGEPIRGIHVTSCDVVMRVVMMLLLLMLLLMMMLLLLLLPVMVMEMMTLHGKLKKEKSEWEGEIEIQQRREGVEGCLIFWLWRRERERGKRWERKKEEEYICRWGVVWTSGVKCVIKKREKLKERDFLLA